MNAIQFTVVSKSSNGAAITTWNNKLMRLDCSRSPYLHEQRQFEGVEVLLLKRDSHLMRGRTAARLDGLHDYEPIEPA
jgi:hypothetical protein